MEETESLDVNQHPAFLAEEKPSPSLLEGERWLHRPVSNQAEDAAMLGLQIHRDHWLQLCDHDAEVDKSEWIDVSSVRLCLVWDRMYHGGSSVLSHPCGMV